MQTNNNKDNLAATAWDSLWQEGVTPWDLGGPTKALISELQRQRPILERTLIPGCGSGHDLMSLARYLDDDGLEENNNDTHHATIVGLEISRTSLQHAQQVVEESMERNGPLSQKTTIELYEGDFFAVPSTWKRVYTTSATATMDDDTTSKQLPENTSSFDFIFDYTFFCAIPPNLRSDWGQQISSRLLSRPHGQLLTFMFPYAATNPKPNASPAAGPPFPVSLKDYRQALPWLLLQTPYPYASIDTVAARQGQEVMGWWSFPPPSSKLGAANTTYCTYTHTY
jgi:SAM-dependent methyltransferase